MTAKLPLLGICLACLLLSVGAARPAWAADARDPYRLYLEKTLHVDSDVTACVLALTRAVKRNPYYDRLLNMDGSVLRARVSDADDTLFSAGQPVAVDKVIRLNGMARQRGSWDWNPVRTRCGLRDGHVVATSIQLRFDDSHSVPGGV